ncbi:MAG: hypothetical protein ABEI78_02450, partial [Candidatus Nanohaloarchaea archaeon]
TYYTGTTWKRFRKQNYGAMQIKQVNNTVYTNITGIVVDKNRETITSGIIQITRPDGTTTTTNYKNGEFTFTPENKGTYKLQAVKPKQYINSKTVSVKYVPDKDGDGVPKSKDKCPGKKGVKENQGCPPINVEIRVTSVKSKDYVSPSEIVKNKKYELSLVNENGTRLNFTGKIQLAEMNQSIEFKDGITTKPVTFSSKGSYNLKLENGKYSKIKSDLEVSKQKLLPGYVNMKNTGIVLGILVIIIAAVLYLQENNGLTGNKNGQDPGAMSGETQLEPEG